MGPTSLTLTAVLGLVALAVLVGAVWLWPRLARNHWLTISGRVGVFLLSQLTIVLVLAVLVNRYYQFYTTWDDVLGIQSKGTLHSKNVNPNAPVKLVAFKGSETVDMPGGNVPDRAGQLQSVVLTGQRSGISSPAYVYLPPQYFQPQFKDRRFPVVVVLTGYPGDARNLITRMAVPKTAADEINAGKVQPTIYVLMRPTVVTGRDTECTDVPNGPQTATFFAQDVPAAVGSAFRTLDGAQSWGIMGDSTGGYCAVKLAMTNSDRYGAAVGMSTDYSAPQDGETGDLYGGSKDVRNENDLIWRLKNLPSPPVSILVTSSKVGESNYPATQEFLKLAKPPMRADSLILDSGGHNFKTWTTELPGALEWLSQRQTTTPPALPPDPPAGVDNTPLQTPAAALPTNSEDN